MLHVAICDDEFRERQELKAVLERELESRNVPAAFTEYESGEELLDAWQTSAQDFKLLFLDIFMKKLNGVETARRLRKAGCKGTIVFLTVTPDFAPEGYEVEAAGYLMKPLDREKLLLLLDRFFKRENHSVLSFRSGTNVFRINAEDILYVESNRNVLIFHTVRENISLYGRLKDVASQLPEYPFLRCHQSFLINMNRVFSVKDDFHMENGDIVPIRVRERKIMRDAYFQYITGKE
ncbi:MAG: LytTR family DNA-binding domain-containing protein [Eubacteriales bacterium]|nr:LytTR family DNA-binding domain-containing protein [Eubacteriales bacterium]